jgi:hypothetical protein
MDEWQTLLDCCDAVSLVRIRDGMTKGLAPVIGYLRCVASTFSVIVGLTLPSNHVRLFKRVLKASDPELAKIVLA